MRVLVVCLFFLALAHAVEFDAAADTEQHTEILSPKVWWVAFFPVYLRTSVAVICSVGNGRWMNIPDQERWLHDRFIHKV